MFLGPASKYEGLFEVPFPTPGESSRPRDWTHVYSHFLCLLALAGRFFTASSTWEARLTATPKSLPPLAWCCRDFPGVASPSDILGVVNIWYLLGRAPTAPVLAWKSEARPRHLPPVPRVLTAPVTLAWFLTLTCARLQPTTEPLDMVSVLQPKELSLVLLLPLTPTSPFYSRS